MKPMEWPCCDESAPHQVRSRAPASKRVQASAATLCAVLALLATLGWAPRTEAVQAPLSPEGRLSDYAGVLTVEQRVMLDAQLLDYEQAARSRAEPTAAGRQPAGAPQIAVVILPSLDGAQVEVVALNFAERWKIGSKSDDGVLLLIAVGERKIRIEVGYGAEAQLPDALCARIIDELMAPRLQNGDYFGGLSLAVGAIHQALSGRAVPGPGAAASKTTAPWGPRQMLLLGGMGGLLLLLLLLGLLTPTGRAVERFLFWIFLQSIFSSGRRGNGGFAGGGGKFGGGGASGKY